ncbi:MAG TPA: ABC transporter permease [Ignavibacteriaceae bacterium]|nr:ABC transporter permease [Ignavibacteriaceae bacterium]
MFRNYLKIAIRNLKKSKGNSLINILGLAVGIASCVIILLYIRNELGYDKFYKNADSIYRVYIKSSINGNESCNCKTAAPLGNTLVHNFPEVITFTRIGFFGNHALKYNDKLYRERHLYTADSNFFDVFSLPLINGNPKTVLSQPNCIVMTQSAAQKYFGNENPVGKFLSADSQSSYMVTGVMKDFPVNSSFRFDILLSMSTYPATENDRWLDMSYTTYIVLKKGTDPVFFQKKLKNIVNDYVGPQAESVLGIPFREFLNKGNKWDFYLQPFTSIYLYSQREYEIDKNTEWADQNRSNIDYVYIFSAIAFFILLLAVINFINLTTARSETRSKEVGIKKSLGSNKTKLIGQFLTESIIVALLSVLISIVLIEIILPFFNQLAGKNLKLELFNGVYIIPGLILFAVVIGILSGSYPAFYLSSFRPVHLFKSSFEKRITKSTLRSGLVVVQFIVSIALIIGTIIIRDQINYMQNKNLGFNKEQLYTVINFGVPENKIHVIKQELLKNSDIISLTNSSIMFFPGIPGDGYSYNERQVSSAISSQYLDVDYNFLKTFKIPLVRGRFFSEEFPSDTGSVVINEAMNKECGNEDPVGKELIQIGQLKRYKIIGVIKNFNYQSLHEQFKPLVLFLSQVNQAASILTIRISSENMKNTIEFINSTWKNFTGGEDIYSSFIDQDLARLYRSEERAGTVAAVFSALAIFIACLGLFGLASFITEQRKKEIGIRKVLGASVFELITMLSREFTKWVLIANIIAWPLAFYVMNNWLNNFAYRINITPWVFILSGIAALIIALLTVSSHAIKAAAANPIKSLRYE